MSNSSLVDYTLLSPHYTKNRKYPIRKITPHHMAGNLTVEACGRLFNGDRKASSNYGIDSNGDVGLYVNEEDRAWTSGNAENDHQAITIEVANDEIGGQWHVSDKALNKLIDLCVDICIRNGIDKLVYTGDASGNLTMHKMFQATTCPGPYLESKFPYIADEVNKRLNKKESPAKTCIDMSESEIYNYLLDRGLTPAGVCGLMGNLFAESGLRADNLQNNGNRILSIEDNEFVVALDTGAYSKEIFIKDGYGFGLAQWTFWSRKEQLYDYVTSTGASFGCIKTQLDFLLQELVGYKSVINILKTTKSVREASDIVLLQYEKPADKSEAVKIKRESFANVYYDKYVLNKHELKIGDKVKLKAGATQYDNKPIRQDYMDKVYTLTKLSGTRAVLSIDNIVIYAVDINNLIAVNNEVETPVFEIYKVRVNVDALNYRKGPGLNYDINGVIRDRGVYTIVDEQNGWGKLKSGAGWISLSYTNRIV